MNFDELKREREATECLSEFVLPNFCCRAEANIGEVRLTLWRIPERLRQNKHDAEAASYNTNRGDHKNAYPEVPELAAGVETARSRDFYH